MEQVDLTNPITYPSLTNYRIHELMLYPIDKAIVINLIGDNGDKKTAVYNSTTEPTGESLLKQLNTSDNRVVSLNKKIYNFLINQGIIEGNVSGVPD